MNLLEEFYNVIVGCIASALLIYFTLKIYNKKTGKHVTIIAILSFIIGMTIHSAMGHTLGEWLKKIFHFHEKDE